MQRAADAETSIRARPTDMTRAKAAVLGFEEEVVRAARAHR
jgi:hypothetical protein